MKSGFSGLFLSVGASLVVIYMPGLPVMLSWRLGIDVEVGASEVTLTMARVGWLGTRLFARDCVMLTWGEGARLAQLAVRPLDGDLSRLQSALVAAGAISASR